MIDLKASKKNTVLVKFNKRGSGAGAGPIDYLLGKQRDRDKAKLLRGDPDQLVKLIDSLDFKRRYTSGTLSFSEPNIDEKDKQKMIDSFEKTLLAGLDVDQYSSIWVEHRDKNRLELNFVFANVELKTSKRLQPYFHRADKNRIAAWQQLENDMGGYTDPNDPARKRFFNTAHDLSKDRKQAVELITNALKELITIGEICNRADVVKHLKVMKFEIARETNKSISIKNPAGKGKNIRLKGALYERDFDSSTAANRRAGETQSDYRADREVRIARTRTRLAEAIKRKREANLKQYQTTRSVAPIAAKLDRSAAEAFNRSAIDLSGIGFVNDDRTANHHQAHDTLDKLTETELKNGGNRRKLFASVRLIVATIRATIQQYCQRFKRSKKSTGRAEQHEYSLRTARVSRAADGDFRPDYN